MFGAYFAFWEVRMRWGSADLDFPQDLFFFTRPWLVFSLSPFLTSLLHSHHLPFTRVHAIEWTRVFCSMRVLFRARTKDVCVCVKKVEDFHFPLCKKKDVFFFNAKGSEEKGKRKEQKKKICALSLALSLKVRMILQGCALKLYLCMFMVMVIMCITCRARIASLPAKDSCCRGDIVNIPSGSSRARIVQPKNPTALWRFRASTSSSLSDHVWLHYNTERSLWIHNHSQQDIRGYGDYRFQLRLWQCANPKAH